MNNHFIQQKKKRRYPIFTLISLLLIQLVFLASCGEKKTPKYEIVHLNGEEIALLNCSKSGQFFSTNDIEDSITPNAIIIEKSDLISTEDFMFQFENFDTNSLHIRLDETDRVLIINDEPVCIWIPEEEAGTEFLDELSDEEIKVLRSLSLGKQVPELYLPFLEKTAALNEDIGLYFQDTIYNSHPALSLFNPKQLYITTDYLEDLNFLENYTELNTLFLEIQTLASSSPLPELPKLKQLSLIISNDYPKNFLTQNPQIEKLFVVDFLQENFNINNLKNLKALSIHSSPEDLNLVIIDSLTGLECLFIGTDEIESIQNFDRIGKLTSLKWLSFPMWISQEELDTVLTQLNKLEVLELLDTIGSLDLSLIKELPNLKCLRVLDSLVDRTILTSLTELEYLAIPGEVYKDSLYLEALKEALPEAVIVPDSGICMGSGWLLFLFPLMFLFVFFKRRSSKQGSTIQKL